MGFILLEAGYEDDHRVEHLLEHPQELAGSPRDIIKATAAAVLRLVEERVGKQMHVMEFIQLPEEQEQAIIDTRKEAFHYATLELGGRATLDDWKHDWRDEEMLVPALVAVLTGCGWKVLSATRVHSWPRRLSECA